jgi:hypothetical protein
MEFLASCKDRLRWRRLASTNRTARDPELDRCRYFGVSEGLATDIVAWAADWETGDGGAELHREAASLVLRLNQEMGDRYVFVHQS